MLLGRGGRKTRRVCTAWNGFWSCAADEKRGELYLPGSRNVSFHSRFPLETAAASGTAGELSEYSLVKGNGHLFFPVLITVWLGLPSGLGATTPFPDGVSRREIPDRAFPYAARLVFQTENRVVCVSPALGESASPWRFQLTPVTSLAHHVTFYGFHSQNLFS